MAKTKLVINSGKENADGTLTISLQISQGGKTVRVSTGEKVLKDNWDRKAGRVIGGKKGDPLANSKNATLYEFKSKADVKIANNSERVAKMDIIPLRDFLMGEDQVVDTDFFSYIDRRIDAIRSQGRVSTVRLYTSLKNKVQAFWVASRLDMTSINVRWLEQFETYCRKPVAEGEDRVQMTTNGVAVYMRYLRILMNDAIDDNLIENYPFRKYRIKSIPTAHRDLSVEDVRKIMRYQSPNKRWQMSADIWWITFCLSGISPKDLFYRQHTDVRGGRLEFNRFKTSTYYSILIQPEIVPLLEKYKGEKYLLMFADHCAEERKQVNKAKTRLSVVQWKDANTWNKMINTNLKKVQDDLKIDPAVDLTLYTARHSVASLLRDQDQSLDDIALVLGHKRGDLGITAIYTKESFARADRAMRRLLDYVGEVSPRSPEPDR